MKKTEADEVAVACAVLDQASAAADRAGIPLEEDFAVVQARNALQGALDRARPTQRNSRSDGRPAA